MNTPNDDAIVFKSSYALGEARATENVTITNSQVSGFDVGTMLDGTFRHTQELAPDRDGVTGRIKLGTESNGGFRNITISNCVFEWSRGLAIETVDGGVLEDVTVTNLTMRHVTTAPIFLRLGTAAVRRTARRWARSAASPSATSSPPTSTPRYAAIIAGLRGSSGRGRAAQQHPAAVSRRRQQRGGRPRRCPSTRTPTPSRACSGLRRPTGSTSVTPRT